MVPIRDGVVHWGQRWYSLVQPAPKPTPTSLAAARRVLDLPAHTEHHALYDALATAKLFLVLRARLRLDRVGQLT
jgi:DNA polymerase-3 subunit epsilon